MLTDYYQSHMDVANSGSTLRENSREYCQLQSENCSSLTYEKLFRMAPHECHTR